MSNRADRPATSTAGQTRNHHAAVEAKKVAKRDHTGKYATARDIQARVLEFKSRIAAIKSIYAKFKGGLHGEV